MQEWNGAYQPTKWKYDLSYGSFMQTKHLCVLIHIWIKGEVVAVKPVYALQ